jgi:homocysteine S-methyltransferase
MCSGCCGTTPEHIKQLAATVASLQPRHASISVRAPAPEEGSASDARPEPAPLASRSRLGASLANGSFVASVELLPPRGWDPAALLEGARAARASGVDAVSVVDNPGGRTRMAAIPAGMIVLQGAGIEPIVHYTCRDRNMLGMLSDLLGAAAGGIHNLLLVSGDPPVQGPYPDSTAVFDIDSIGLTNLVAGLNRGVDPGGSELVGGPTRFVIGVAANPGAPDLEREVDRFLWKVDAGADFAVTQPVFSAAELERFLERTRAPIPLLAGIWPLTSLRNAEFLANEVGVQVPEAVVERMRRAQTRSAEHAREEGIGLAREVLAQVRPRVQGVQVSAPGGDVDAALAVLAGAPAPEAGVRAPAGSSGSPGPAAHR